MKAFEVSASRPLPPHHPFATPMIHSRTLADTLTLMTHGLISQYILPPSSFIISHPRVSRPRPSLLISSLEVHTTTSSSVRNRFVSLACIDIGSLASSLLTRPLRLFPAPRLLAINDRPSFPSFLLFLPSFLLFLPSFLLLPHLFVLIVVVFERPGLDFSFSSGILSL